MLISISNLRFRWPKDHRDTLDIPRFEFNQGEHIFLHGPSGSGKSTLLNLLGGVVRPNEGCIDILGRRLTDMGSAHVDRFRADHIGYIFQQFNLIPYLDPIRNVLLPCRFSRARHSSCKNLSGSGEKEAERLLSNLFTGDIPDLTKPVVHLSVGQQQRVAAARALIGRPELIIADEPTSSLDHDARQQFMDLLFQEVENSESTLLFVSHDPTLKARFSRIVDLREINQASR